MSEVYNAVSIPKFIWSDGNSDEFQVVKRACQISKNGWRYGYDLSHGLLVAGKNIIEIPNYDISVLFSVPDGSFIPRHMIPRLADYARLAWANFVSVKPLGEERRSCQSIYKKEGYTYYIAFPRFFRKKTLDDKATG